MLPVAPSARPLKLKPLNMSDKEIIASNLTIAFYSGQQPRQAYLGEEKRRENALAEGQRDFRQGTITPQEVYQVFEQFLSKLEDAD